MQIGSPSGAVIVLVGTLVLVACGSPSSDATDTTTSSSESVTTTSNLSTTTTRGATATTTSSTSTSTTSTTQLDVLLSTEAEFDGEGLTITLFGDGRLVAGSAEGLATLTGAGDFWMDLQARLHAVRLGAAGYSDAIVLELPVAEEEDPPNLVQVFVIEGDTLRRVLNAEYGVYGVTELEFSGDGTIVYQEDGWTACQRIDFGEEANRQLVTLGFVEDIIEEISRRDSSDTQQCDQLAG